MSPKKGHWLTPRLEHMVDTVLYFEGDQDSRYRLIRAVKNRFGAVNELGIFAMTEKGLREINNPSAIFLSRYEKTSPWQRHYSHSEGSRPLLVEIQALVDQTHMGNPRRISIGPDPQRLAMLLAVLHRHGGIATGDQDVFINAAGGVRITETGSDLALLLAVYSSLRNFLFPMILSFLEKSDSPAKHVRFRQVRQTARGGETWLSSCHHPARQCTT